MKNPGHNCCKLPSKAPKEDKEEVTEIHGAAKDSSVGAALRGSFIRTGSQWTTCFDFYKSFSNGVFHLPPKSEFGAMHDVTFELTKFHL